MTASAGIDWGRHRDATAAYVVDYSDPEMLVVTDAVHLPRASQPWSLIAARLRPHLLGCRPILSDGTGVGDALGELVPNAINVVLTGNRRPDAKPTTLLSTDPPRLAVTTLALFLPLFARIRTHQLRIKCKAPGLAEELARFAVSATRNGGIRFAAASGHDDKVFGLALAVFAANCVLDLNPWSDRNAAQAAC